MGIPASIRAKLDWADTHLTTIGDEFEALSTGEGNAFDIVSAPDFKKHALVMRLQRPLPVKRWSLLLSDAIHHLRNSLDHTVFEIAVKEAQSKFPPGEKQLMFPVAHPVRQNWDRLRGRIRTLSDPVQAAIEREQSGPDHLALFILDHLSNVDKHRTLAVTSTLMKEGRFLLGGLPRGTQATTQWFRARMHTNAPFAVIATDRPTPNVKVSNMVLMFRPYIEVHDPKNPNGVGHLAFEDLKVEQRDAVHRVIERLCDIGGL